MQAIVFESPKKRQELIVRLYLLFGFKVWVIEPYHCYHHQGKIRFFPPALPEYINYLIKAAKIQLIRAEELGIRNFYYLPHDLAVESVEKAFFEYRKCHGRIIDYIIKIFKTSKAEDIFKKEFCNYIAAFYSANIMLSKIAEKFTGANVKIYPEFNALFYIKFKRILSSSGQRIYMHNNLSFSLLTYFSGAIKIIKNNVIAFAKLFLQALAGFIFIPRRILCWRKNKKETYDFGIAIVSPSRQLVGNQRGPDFIIDGTKIIASQVVYFPLLKVARSQKKAFREFKGRIYNLPDRKWGNFSHPFKWTRLFMLTLSRASFSCDPIISTSHLALSEFFRWQKVMEYVEIKNFITHADSGFLHIARNIVLKRNKVKTWFFIDSINYPFNYQKEDKPIPLRHPLWSYLYYDNFISWEGSLSEYFSAHPGSINNYYNVGCLWSEHINNGNKENRPDKRNKFIISVFDTTYSCNNVTSYAEGIAFAKDILRLAEELGQGFEIIFKEKKEKDLHRQLDAVLGDKLVALYDKMCDRSNIKMHNCDADSAEIMGQSDMVISFPFTSTTFEALSANKPAIWHDPMGYYKDTIYAKIGGVITHSYEQLKSKVIQIRNTKPGDYKNPIPPGSPFMDPYRDGKAIERFRTLLLSE